jgi:hypothetical protein
MSAPFPLDSLRNIGIVVHIDAEQDRGDGEVPLL